MHFKEELENISLTLLRNEVQFIVIGGFAVNYHGYVRATNDLDIWLKPAVENYLSFVRSLEMLGYDVQELNEIVFDPKKTFIRIPFEKINIEFLTEIPGNIIFNDAWKQSDQLEIGQATVRVLSYDHLIKNKEATNRPKDIQDIIELRRRNKE